MACWHVSMLMYDWASSWEKPAFCIGKNKDAYQLCGNRTADQHLCFRFISIRSLYFINKKFEASTHPLWLYSPLCVSDLVGIPEDRFSPDMVYLQVLPPVRNSLDKKKKKRVKKTDDGTTTTGSGKTKRISSYDYRAWDKFDVVSRFIICYSIFGVRIKARQVVKSNSW